jgi:hypothetical protein
MSFLRTSAGALALAAALGAALAAAPAFAEGGLPGRIILESRLRLEAVDQANLPDTSDAWTLRTRYGWESPKVDGFKLLVEGDNVVSLGGDYFDGVHPSPGRPLVPDPEINRLNRAQIEWSGPAGLDLTVGRQRIVLDNARFVGNSGFRQTETTFDGARIAAKPLSWLSLDYAWLDQDNRSTGVLYDAENPLRGAFNLLHAQAKTPLGQLSVYDYLLDFNAAKTLSSATWGARLVGARPLRKDLSLTWQLEYARQRPYGDNPGQFDLGYGVAGAGLKAPRWEASTVFEELGGDGAHGFQTPFATKHPFQGWSNMFLTTPGAGVRDLYLRGVATPGSIGGHALRVVAEAHAFSAARGGFRYGRELDLGLYAPITKKLKASLEGAWFKGERAGYPDTTKTWVSLEYSY